MNSTTTIRRRGAADPTLYLFDGCDTMLRFDILFTLISNTRWDKPGICMAKHKLSIHFPIDRVIVANITINCEQIQSNNTVTVGCHKLLLTFAAIGSWEGTRIVVVTESITGTHWRDFEQ